MKLGSPRYWLSPSAASKLLACPASVTLLPTETPSPLAGAAKNVGSLAHDALRRWVAAEHWRSPVGDSTLPALYRSCATDLGLSIAELPGGRQTEARLLVKAPALGALLRKEAGPGGVVHSEHTLYDHSRKLWGTVDVLVTRDGTVPLLLDLKTGQGFGKGDVPLHVTSQLTFYAGLVEYEYGELPRLTAAFTLRRGSISIPIATGDICQLHRRLEEAREGWAQHIRPALPEPVNCRYCRRRFSCEAHWQALDTWEGPDALEGVILQVEIADSSRAAVLLRTSIGDRWISGVPAAAVRAASAGQRLRAVRLGIPPTDTPGCLPTTRMHEQSEVRVTEGECSWRLAPNDQ